MRSLISAWGGGVKGPSASPERSLNLRVRSLNTNSDNYKLPFKNLFIIFFFNFRKSSGAVGRLN